MTEPWPWLRHVTGFRIATVTLTYAGAWFGVALWRAR